MGTYRVERAREAIVGLCTEGHDVVTLWRAVGEQLQRAVPHMDPGACWYTVDPASLLITSHYAPAVPVLPTGMLEHEYYADDVNQLIDVARSPAGVSTLHDATGGNPSSSPRWHANMELGGDQEMIAALRTRTGEVWGALGIYREPGRDLFTAEDVAFVRSVVPHLAEGARRGLLLAEATEPDRPDAPGLLVLSERWEVESSSPGVDRWLRDLPDGDVDAGRLPSAVLSVAAQALRSAREPDPGTVSFARVLGRSGSWVVLHGAALVAGDQRRAAVIVEPAHPARIAPLLMAAYGLTPREQEITRLVLQGSSTADIAQELFLSPYTVQEHLENVFDKTGVRSRRDLVGQILFAHYEPRVRDNEQRAATARPVRGGPVPSAAG